MKSSDYRVYSKFLENLAKKLTKFYYSKLNKPFKVTNKLEGKGYDPVTNADKAFEKFIRSQIKNKFPSHQIIGEEFGIKKTKSNFSWVIDPIDGTRSFVIGNPTWSNLISLNYNGVPVIGLANFPVLKKYYLNVSKNSAYIFEKGKKKRIKVNHKARFSSMKLSAAFHGELSLQQQKKIPKILKRMQFPCADALSYAHFAEGKIDVVLQCSNKIWDIHPLIPIIEAASGIITTWKNESAINAGNIICSSNNKLHKEVLKILRPVTR
tara:strand:- start:3002 stop:3799 length:798 start_codon:yes stop_codon:yes gene_type:complete